MNRLSDNVPLNTLKWISPTIRSLPNWGYYILSDSRYYVTAHSTTVSIQIVCDLDRMIIVACIPEKNQLFSLEYSDQSLPPVEPCICCSGILDLSEEGRRWEGMVYKGMPCGLGTLYDNEGRREYSGFLMGDTKVCYGTEYYSDIEKPMYEGPFCSGVRCGEGTLWDRQGAVIHSGFFAGDPIVDTESSPFFFFDIQSIHTLEDSYTDTPKELFLSTWLTELKSITIGNHSFCNTTRLVIEHLPRLESIEIGEDCFRNTGEGTMRLRGCSSLRSFVCGGYCFAHYRSCEISQCPCLTVIDMANYCFEYVETVSIHRTCRSPSPLKI